jgi:hypothetical protein
MESRPPWLAVWLLRQFGASLNNEAIIGDLHERYARGETRVWYWRQVLLSVLSGAYSQIRDHKLLAFRGLIVGLVLLRSIANFVFAAFGYVIVTTDLMDDLFVAFALFSAVLCALGFVVGWAVACTHRSISRALMLPQFASILLFLAYHAFTVGIDGPLRVGGSFASYALSSMILSFGTVVGTASYCGRHSSLRIGD